MDEEHYRLLDMISDNLAVASSHLGEIKQILLASLVNRPEPKPSVRCSHCGYWNDYGINCSACGQHL